MAHPQNPEVSILITASPQAGETRHCLESLSRHTLPGFEMVLVLPDTISDREGYLAVLTDGPFNLHRVIIAESGNAGRLRNTAAWQASGQVLVFLDGRAVVTPGWLAGLLRALELENAGMAGPATNAPGSTATVPVDYDELEDLDAFAEKRRCQHAGQVTEVEVLTFSCAALNRATYEQVGAFAEDLPHPLVNDRDYALRMQKKGLRLLVVEDVFVHQAKAGYLPQVEFASTWESFQASQRNFEAKWWVRWKPARPRPEVLDDNLAALWQDKLDLSLAVAGLQRRVDEMEHSAAGQIFRWSRRLRLKLFPENSAAARRLDAASAGMGKFFRRLSGGINSLYYRGLERQEARRQERLRQKLGRELDEILASHSKAKEVVVFVPTISWKTDLFQRPHQLALEFARQGCLVFFCELPFTGLFAGQFHPVNENLYVLGKAPLDIFRRIDSPVVFVLAYNKADLDGNFTNPRVVYEYIDELKVFWGDLSAMERDHTELVKSAQVVAASAGKLYHEVAESRPDALYSPNAVDLAFFNRALQETQAPPGELAGFVEKGQPIIGYYGALARWFDYPLLLQVAQLRPAFQFILIGPDYDGSLLRWDVGRFENIHWLNQKPYPTLPAYLKYFDVAIIPFKLNAITHSTSPLKLFEYACAAKPVVTTAMRECQKYPQVLIADDGASFAEKLDEALLLRQDLVYREALLYLARQNTWEIRVRQYLDAVKGSHT